MTMALVAILTGCTEDKTVDYLYTIGIEDYSYTGESIIGPLGYLSGLDITDKFIITSGSETDADAQAKVIFDAEMAKINISELANSVSGTYRFRYVLYSVQAGGEIADREFTNR